MYPRYCQRKISAALQDTPVVIIAGPRQCGKTTLAKALQKEDCEYVTLDDLVQYEAAKDDPIGFVRSLTASQIIIDEVQRVPELFLSIKQSVDENRIAGRYLLTGSANALMLPQLSDSLAGRMEVVPLLPLAECEIQSASSTFIDKILSDELPKTKLTRIKDVLIMKVLNGGFPEPLQREGYSRKMAWHIQYINSIVQKDIKDLGGIDNLEVMPKLIQVLSHQVGKLTNFNELAGKIGLSRQTMFRYFRLLEQLYIYESLPAWHRNDAKRLIKTPKVHIVDTGLMAAMKRLTPEKLEKDRAELGTLVESYVLCELKRLATWHDEPLYFYHYRDKDKVEVDIVIETMTGDVYGIEVKASSTVKKSDFNGLERLKTLAGNNFKMGMILYDGDHSTSHGDKLFSLPIASLWE